MKKLLMSSIVLFLFAASITMVQVSCSKSNAGNAKVTTLTGKVFYSTLNLLGQTKYWIAHSDGSNATEIVLALPANVTVDPANQPNARLSADGTKIYFIAQDNTLSEPRGIYSADVSGANVTRIINNTPSTLLTLQSVN